MSDARLTNDYRPRYYDLLSPTDQEQYDELRSTLSSQMCRNRRGKRLEGFSEMLASIRTFCIRHSEDDWKRCLVCGVCWLLNGIAINNRQLSILIDKWKSSINGSLQKMDDSTLQSRTESDSALCEAIPLLKNNFNELREWTVQLFVAATPQPALPMYSVNTLHPFQSPMPSQYPAFAIQPRVFLPAAVPMGLPLRAVQQMPAQPQPQPQSFFDDEFALAPAFLADGAAATAGAGAIAAPAQVQAQPPAPAAVPHPGGGDLDLIDAPDPISFPDDPFGLFGEKW
jgi:hypothetical protein